jgi:hypothetical protein
MFIIVGCVSPIVLRERRGVEFGFPGHHDVVAGKKHGYERPFAAAYAPADFGTVRCYPSVVII